MFAKHVRVQVFQGCTQLREDFDKQTIWRIMMDEKVCVCVCVYVYVCVRERERTRERVRKFSIQHDLTVK